MSNAVWNPSRLVAEKLPARSSGLPAGIAVAVGGADAPAAALGLGMAREEDAKGAVLHLARHGGQVLAPVAQPHIDPEGRLHGLAHVVPGQWCVMAAILSAAASLDWVVRLLRPDDPNGSREFAGGGHEGPGRERRPDLPAVPAR